MDDHVFVKTVSRKLERCKATKNPAEHLNATEQAELPKIAQRKAVERIYERLRK